ncbi:MAG: prepilin-type N-terminal cleavage/methylation domain-containing protein [gamma proteobacterium symbiont of Ctena orbiculata]|nr:GspH/FimT family pseudopilin [Candidatus Thiodiazotropha sp. (ex Lucina pensylvanica)]
MRIYQGYTLLELLVTLAIAAVLMAFVVPGFRGLIENNNVATTSNELLGALLYARSEAVRIEGNVTFTPEVDGWLVTAGGTDIVDQTIDNENITLAENINTNDVTYNPRGRAAITAGDNIEVSFDGTVKSRICLSTTGRPYIKKVDEGNCP